MYVVVTARAYIRSLYRNSQYPGDTGIRNIDIVELLDDGRYIVEYEGKLFIAVYNDYEGMFYVDDTHGEFRR